MSDAGLPPHDAVLLFSKTWGLAYLAIVFVAAVIWTYWPSRKGELQRAARRPLEEERPWR